MRQALCWGAERAKKNKSGTSLVAQWLRIHLPMQGTRVRALLRENPTCGGATKPALLEPVLRNESRHRNEKPMHHNEE